MKVLLCLLVLFGCGSKSSRTYDISKVTSYRAEKDKAFKEESWSPIPPPDRIGFNGLQYFPATAAWVIDAQYIPADHVDTVLMSTSTDELRTAIRTGRLVFKVNNTECTLWSFQFIEPSAKNMLFVPFRDATSGTDTYELGRYVEVTMPINGKGVIDFNMAYNPYCAYNYDYSCPLVPYYNTLPVPITAGEKAWH